MTTYLQTLSKKELDQLCSNPESINNLNTEVYTSINFFESINYFINGSPYPLGSTPLSYVISGIESIDCSSLENGCFDIIPPEKVNDIEKELKAINIDQLKSKVSNADFDSLINEEELYDLELFKKEDAIKGIISDVMNLKTFYKKTLNKNLGIVIYTT